MDCEEVKAGRTVALLKLVLDGLVRDHWKVRVTEIDHCINVSFRCLQHNVC